MAEKITLEALRFYAPYLHAAIESEDKLANEDLTPEERNFHETRVHLKRIVLDRIATMSRALITSEINKIIATSHLKYSRDLFDILYYAGLNGLTRGLQKFDINMENVSATNYLFQWFTVYAKRELNVLEAPYGIAPSRFQKYKKISAVRKSLAVKLGREPSNEEVFEYFQSGAADIKNMNGPTKKAKRSLANKLITIELIKEQEEFETKYMYTQLFDPTEEKSREINESAPQRDIFDESVFGVFIKEHPVTTEARVVLLSELQYGGLDDELSKLLENMSNTKYRSIVKSWKNLIKDADGPFCNFLRQQADGDFGQLDITESIKDIESFGGDTTPQEYDNLFAKGKD